MSQTAPRHADTDREEAAQYWQLANGIENPAAVHTVMEGAECRRRFTAWSGVRRPVPKTLTLEVPAKARR